MERRSLHLGNVRWTFLLILLVMLVGITPEVRGQLGNIGEDRRFDIGYKLRGYAYSYHANPQYSDKLALIRKGFITTSYKHYFTDHLFLNWDAGLLLHNQRTNYLGGPVNFNALEMGGALGVRWGDFSLYTGLTGGTNWDYQVRYKTPANKLEWHDAASPGRSLYGGLRFGFKYHLLPFFTIKSEIRNTHYNHPEIEPARTFNRAPAIVDAELAQFSASVGISVGIPWSTKKPSSNRPPTSILASPARSREDIDFPSPSEVSSELEFQKPMGANHVVTAWFGDQRGHEGIDLDLKVGDKIHAAADGRVVKTSWVGAYGKMVEIKHAAGFSTRYAHLSNITVKKGQEVSRGDTIGLGGNSGRSTGPHLHFELLYNSFPVNPRRYMDVWE